MESIVGYTPLDLTAIQHSLPKTIKKVTTDKDLEIEVSEIQSNLKDLSKYYF